MQTIMSVGIDVGTSTTQVVFSRLSMDDSGGFFSVPRVSIVDKEVVYKSEVYLTPLVSDVWIDTDALKEIVAGEYARAGFSPSDMSSGAVIITGESARKENADAVLESLSGFAGDFVVSAAGPDMESLIAGKGSGAFQYSIDHHARVANLDIGGGTTNVVIFDDGAVTARGCLDIGGRLIRVDEGSGLVRISPAAAKVAAAEGIQLRPGQKADLVSLTRVTDRMARVLEGYLGLGPEDVLTPALKTPGSSDFERPGHPDAVFFSGGVADLIYHPAAEDLKYGDIGVLLGRSIRGSRLCSDFHMGEPGETIRATVVGAGSYTTTISGSTISYSEDIFPLKNIPVVKLDEALQASLFRGEKDEVAARIRWYQAQNDVSLLILAMPGKRDPGYGEMKLAAAAIYEIMDQLLPAGAPVLLVIECDIAKAMGQMIRQLPGMDRQVVAIDSIQVSDGEYVDMGRPLMNGMVIPVVVKTLIFG